ncbi:amidase signature domain-containing protein [Leptodontidium sp. 2 PMI_412]|nr:amidase signature domain-containing protein [Leptodontidium sp. 2 PMI_412]
MGAPFDVLTTTAADLRVLLEDGSTTCVDLVETYLAQIEKHNHAGAKLHAMISLAPKDHLVAIARGLDEERSAGKARGPLHGIPIIVKDAFATDPALGMPTTVGSYVLLDSRPKQNASAVEALIQNGLIILGKSNLTAPGGSSTGSAVGVAAGFSPVSLGTETSGSLTSPASRVALYALKFTPGSVSMEGVWEVARSYDTAGAMAKNVIDLVHVSDILRQTMDDCKPSLTENIQNTWQGLSVGFVDIEKWRLLLDTKDPLPGYDEQSAREYLLAIDKIREHGGRVVHPVHITPPEGYIVDEDGGNVDDLMDDVMKSQAREGCEKYLSSLAYTKVHNVKEIIEFNDSNVATEFDENLCPNQNGLRRALDMNMPADERERKLQICRQWAATEGVDKVILEHEVDVIVGPCDSFFAGVGVGAQYPLASIPFGYVESSGRPYGLHVIARAHEEGKIVSFMSAWESIWPVRRVPDLTAAERSML